MTKATMVAQAIAAAPIGKDSAPEEHAWYVGHVIDPFGHECEIGKPIRYRSRFETGCVDPVSDGWMVVRPGCPYISAQEYAAARTALGSAASGTASTVS